MKTTRRFLLALTAVVLAAGCGEQINFQRIIATAKTRVYPALVYVKPIRETFEAGERQRAEVFGSGVIISPDGYVVTNHHVAEKAIEVHCVLGDREQVPATVVGLDPETDLALLKLRLPQGHRPLPVATFGDSNLVDEGQFVMALGAPFGFTRSISLGIISNTKRYIGFQTQYRYSLWLQTDAAINPGNSGGPLVNIDGQVIGINTLGTWAENIGFAIPSNVAGEVIGRLRRIADAAETTRWPVKVDRAYLGLQLQALNDFNTNTFTDSQRGVLIQNVDERSPGAEAGIRGGDLLLAVNDQPLDGVYVEDLPMIRVMLADLPAGREARFVLARRDAKDTPPPPYVGEIGNRGVQAVAVTPITRGKFEGEDFDCPRWNMTLKEITKFSNPALHFLHPAGGVFVQGVRHPGNAADAGMEVNDILLTVGEEAIKTIQDAKAAYEQLTADPKRPEKKVLITIKRGRFLDWKTLDWSKDYLKED